MTLSILQIAGLSVVPAAGAAAAAAPILYGAYGWRSISPHWWLDGVLWAGFLLTYFGLSFGIMKLDSVVHLVPATTPTQPATDSKKLTIAGWSIIPAAVSAMVCGAALFLVSPTPKLTRWVVAYAATLMNFLVTFFGLSVAFMSA